jgi:hypothetical protein
MSVPVIAQPAIGAPEPSISRSATSPWLSWAGLVASAGISSGIYWDISWHETIGRDTFWTPAHLLTQFGAVLAGLVAAWVIFGTTLRGAAEARQTSVNVLGFRGPLGAFILAWGAAAMLTSAPFDNWWHDAYGLDVKIISPPHMLLALGIFGINWGAAFVAAAEMNRAQGAERKMLQYVLLCAGGFILIQMMILELEQTGRVWQHSAAPYVALSIVVLFVLETMARVSQHRWARTIVAGTYTVFGLLMLWILPLFPAQPKLGPVYQNITHMVPLPFPILLVVPAFVLDLIWPKLREPERWNKGLRAAVAGAALVLQWPLILLNLVFSKQKKVAWDKWLQAAAGGVIFLPILIAVQWPFATFMMSPAANNWFFANNNFPYFAHPDWPEVRHVFVNWETTAQFWTLCTVAFALSVVSMRTGIALGSWLSRVRR